MSAVPPAALPAPDDSLIAPSDVLAIRVFKLPELSGDYEVDPSGRIAMPLVGKVQAAGLTADRLDALLTERLGDRYLERPDVSVTVKASSRRNVTVDGSVRNAGSFPVNGPMSLMQAVALAGGTGEDANPRRVAVFRTIGGKRQAAAFDLASIRRGQAPDPAIYAGDIVIVDGSALKAAQRQLLNSVPLLSILRP